MKKPKVALVHDYLVQFGGAEKTLEAICEIYPDAPIYTGIYEPQQMTDLLNSKDIHSSKSSLFKRFPKHLTFLMPLVFESFDLSEYDIIISDGTAWPKSVITRPDQLHISYVHTPPRFLYKYSVESTKRNAWYFKPFVTVIDHFLRIWDFGAAQRPDFLLTNSNETRKRIEKFYARDATVIYPPVDTDVSQASVNHEKAPYFLALGRLAAYKNFDVLVKAFNLTNHKLIIAGTGPEEEKLKEIAGNNVEIVGRVTSEKKHELLSNALGLINLVKDEDFGIVPVEAMAHGIPVLAYKAGGHLETVVENVTGRLIDTLDPEEVAKEIMEFYSEIKNGRYDKETLKAHSQKYAKLRFQKELKEFIEEKYKEHINAGTS